MSERTITLTQRLSSRSEPRVTTAVVVVTLAVIAAAELLTTYVSPLTGIALHALLLSALMIAGGTWEERPASQTPGVNRFLYALTLVPLIRIFSLSMPLISFDQPYWYIMASLPLSAAILVVMAALGLSPRAVGISLGRRLYLQPPIIALGFGLGIAEYYILRPEPLIGELTLREFVVPALILLAATGFLEELLFRGVLQRTAASTLGPAFGVIYVSAVFALLHIGYRSALDMAFVFGIALIYGWAVSKTGSIIGVSLSHGLTNIVLFLVVPFLAPLSAGILTAGLKA